MKKVLFMLFISAAALGSLYAYTVTDGDKIRTTRDSAPQVIQPTPAATVTRGAPPQSAANTSPSGGGGGGGNSSRSGGGGGGGGKPGGNDGNTSCSQSDAVERAACCIKLPEKDRAKCCDGVGSAMTTYPSNCVDGAKVAYNRAYKENYLQCCFAMGFAPSSKDRKTCCSGMKSLGCVNNRNIIVDEKGTEKKNVMYSNACEQVYKI